MRIGIVDIGTLSLRFDLYEPGHDEPVVRHRSMPRLGDLLYSRGALGEPGVELLVRELNRVQRLAQEHGAATIIAVGTSVFRDAHDGLEVIGKVAAATGVAIRVLSGEEEACLTVQGILAREREISDESVCADIGGGSTEVTWCSGREPIASLSLNLGVVRLRERFFHGEPESIHPYGDVQIESARNEIRRELLPIGEGGRAPESSAKGSGNIIGAGRSADNGIRSPRPREMIGSSGTVRTLERLNLTAPVGSPRISIQALREFTNSAIALSPKELLNIPGVERSRADVLIPGLLILEGLTTKLPVVEIVVSHFSLRHGVLDEARKDPKIERHPGNGAREEKYQ